MTQTFEVIWAGVAEHDLKDIVAYSAPDSPTNALKILPKIKQKVSNLYIFSEQGRPVPELYEQGILIYRELIVEPWRIIYRVAEKQVFVLAVLDARHNIEDILLRRLTYYQ